ncbi:MAG: arginase family protein [Alphaproteobacteria bacterium]|nr:arginase family protein [Alphaproteobacteria bacterium]
MTNKPDLGALFGAKKSKTFLGLDACNDLDFLAAPMAVIGVPCASPYRSVGAYCRNGPNALRQAMSPMSANLAHHNFDVGGMIFPEERLAAVDCGDLPYDENDAPGNRKIIRQAIEKIISKGAVPIVLGGDDSVPIPMLQAFAGAGKFTILQIDAHIDWRDEHMGERMGLSSNMRRASEMQHVEHIIQVGARGTGSARPNDFQDALDWGVKFVTAYELHLDGIGSVIKLIPENSTVIICFDIDALDPTIVPGVIGRAPGGLTYYQAVDLIKGAAERARIAAIDFVEFMPERDIDGLGALTTAQLVTTALGVIARQAQFAADTEPDQ